MIQNLNSKVENPYVSTINETDVIPIVASKNNPSAEDTHD